MSFKSTLKLDSRFFDPRARQRAASRAVAKTIRAFAGTIQNKMENSPHTGKTVTKVRGVGFSIRHQQSKRGERPSPFTRKLLRSVKPRKISETRGIVEVGAEYAENLLELGRVIVSAKDLSEGQNLLNKNCLQEIKNLL